MDFETALSTDDQVPIAHEIQTVSELAPVTDDQEPTGQGTITALPDTTLDQMPAGVGVHAALEDEPEFNEVLPAGQVEH